MFIKRILPLVWLAITAMSSPAQKPGIPTGVPQAPRYPRLVLGIVVDQMKYDYIYRFWDKLGGDGFKKLVNNGYVFKNTQFTYMPTYTGPGHASIFTGANPSEHGIIGNNWFERKTNDTMYCVNDPAVRAVGGSDIAGRMSPRNLLTTTLGDELKLRFNFKSKVFGIALKDRGAILPAGHAADAAYWYDGATGHWMTSSFYMEKLPSWLHEFNARNLPDRYLSEPWNTLLPVKEYIESTPDDTPYERPFAGETKPVFPHDIPAFRIRANYDLLKSIPAGNTFTLEMAMELIRAEKLGHDDYPDLLAVSFSSTDYIGHQFGPNSIEIQDCYLRLDHEIAALLAMLEKELGAGNVLVFLTADHGAAPNTRLMQDHRIPAATFNSHSLADTVSEYLNKIYGPGAWVSLVDENMVYMNQSLVREAGHDLREMQQKVADLLAARPSVAHAVTSGTLREQAFSKPPLSLLQNGFMAQRSGDVMMVPRPGFSDWGPTGTTHGSPYPYDTRVPLIFWGWKISNGSSMQQADITGIAPTLSLLFDMDFPNGCTGKPITGLWPE